MEQSSRLVLAKAYWGFLTSSSS